MARADGAEMHFLSRFQIRDSILLGNSNNLGKSTTQKSKTVLKQITTCRNKGTERKPREENGGQDEKNKEAIIENAGE